MLTGAGILPKRDGQEPRPLSRRSRVGIAMLLALYACGIVQAAWVGGDPYYNNDESRHLLTGAFWCDFFTELPFDDPVGFAKRYYAQYPNLGLLVSPPLFHVLEGGVFRLFGVSMSSAKLLMSAFCAVFLIGWWFWVRAWAGAAVATWSTLLVPLVHDVFELSGHAMLEVPTLAWMVVTLWMFRRYLDGQRAGWLWGACGCAAAVALTRYHAPIVLGPLVVQLALSRQWHLLRRATFWLPVFVAGGLSAAYYVWTLEYYHTWHSLLAGGGVPEFGLLIRQTLKSLGTIPAWITAAGAAGVVILPLLRRRLPLPPLAWMAATGLMWLGISYRPTRFLVYAWPAAVTLGIYTLFMVADRCRVRRLGHVAAALALLATAWGLYAAHPPGLQGYDEAAARAMAASETGRIFIHGRQDGVFIWHVRRRDPGLTYTVLRASKVLSSGEPDAMNDFRVLAESDAQILARLDALGVDVVVSEDLPELNVRPYQRLVKLLDSDRFDPIGEVPIRNHQGRIYARRLTLYRFRRKTPVSDGVAIPLTALGPEFELRVDLSRPLRGWRQHRRVGEM